MAECARVAAAAEAAASGAQHKNAMAPRNPQDTDVEFALAEFVQLHEHIRQQDNSMMQLVTVLLLSSTALMSAVGAYVFQQVADGETIAVPTGYLFLTPIFILVPGLAMLRAHRKNIYRMGTYVKIFHENPPGGAQWHHGLAEFKSGDGSESLDHVPMIVWMLAALSVLLFLMALVLSQADWVHWLAPIPMLAMVAVGHRNFNQAKNAAIPEAAWVAARNTLRCRTRPGSPEAEDASAP